MTLITGALGLGALRTGTESTVSWPAAGKTDSARGDVDFFAVTLDPGALDAIRHADAWGPSVLLSDGDVVFQPRKAQRSGAWDAVDGRVLIYIHKEAMLDDVEQRFPARHYVMVDDKLRILAAMKGKWQKRLTTVWPRQGHYAMEPNVISKYGPADVSLERIADLSQYGIQDLRK